MENNMVPRDGKMYKMIDNVEHVGVLVSRGYGAGWYSWNTDIESCLFDPEIVSIVEEYKNQDMSTQLLYKIAAIAEHKWPERYWGGADGLRVEWLPAGTKFKIVEYGGAESIEILENVQWFVA